MATNQSEQNFYHVCPSCNAKFFTTSSEATCPQCETTTTSSEARPLPSAKQQSAAELEACYLLQQQRLACPGCGELPFIG